jgi:hypothetical protein
LYVQACLNPVLAPKGLHFLEKNEYTLSALTRSAACRRVSPDISSTIRPISGSVALVNGGGGGAASVEDGGLEVAAVARHREELVLGQATCTNQKQT